MFSVLEKLNAIGKSLSSESDINHLLESILLAAQDITEADGGTLYLVTEEGGLKYTMVHNHTLNIHLGGSSGDEISFPDLPLSIDGQANHSAIAAHCAITGQSVNIRDAYQESDFDFSGTKAFDSKMGYRTQSVLAIPLISHQGKVMAVLQLINAKASDGKTIEFGLFQQKLAESLASQASIVMQNRMLVVQLEQLFEGLINLINTAIDEKSPYTGGHCMRVPELAQMLAEAVHHEDEGPLASFRMTDKDRYELKIASMLHDCGKITTPVHVVDKATKLETIFDRIQLIETRFEAVHLSIDRQALSDAASRPEEKVSILAAARAEHEQLANDLDFLRHANIGSERMQAEDIERVQAIAARAWTDAHGRLHPLLTEEEVSNLIIVAGTLTAAERKVINDHIVSTIGLLEQLPWPEHLLNVTEYAGGHHERMDGKGYPRGLRREEMSIQARIMGIADIFEALTASDRPYKKAMPLSQSLSIMHKMKENQHIDPDLFDVFIKHGIHHKYAQKFLSPEQIDIT